MDVTCNRTVRTVCEFSKSRSKKIKILHTRELYVVLSFSEPYKVVAKGGGGGPGVPVTPLCKPFF